MNKVSIFILLICIYIDNVSSQLKKEFSLNKNEYYVAESIFYHIKVTNESEFTDSVSSSAFDGVYNCLGLEADDKREILQNSSTGFAFKKIKPGEVFEAYGNVLDFLGDKFVNTGGYGGGYYLNEGTFKLTHCLLRDKFFDIKVIKPAGSELEVLNKLLSAFNIKDLKIGSSDTLYLKMHALHQIALEHPQSLYWEKIVYEYNKECDWLRIFDTDIDLNKDFISRYPNSFYMELVLLNLSKSIFNFQGGEPAIVEYLNHLIAKNPGSLAEKEAKKLLKSNDYLK